jgi:hypothetical protein
MAKNPKRVAAGKKAHATLRARARKAAATRQAKATLSRRGR